ncbi:hypothetical protein BJ165DRAFT_1457081 [Panaeolus papilionaceus]|nr:hypothetical protein BJ165DRAFT_1457081 [Panaeolus papilionaceus]
MSFSRCLSTIFRSQLQIRPGRLLRISTPGMLALPPRTMSTKPLSEPDTNAGLAPLLLLDMPKSKVMPALNKEELGQLLEPLRQRTWKIDHITPNDGFNQTDEESPFLTRKIRFKGPVSARKFVTELMRIEDEEQHHISFNLWSGKRPIVTIFTQTHCAQVGGETRPAITSRDIRLAARLESFLGESQLTFKGGRVEESQ